MKGSCVEVAVRKLIERKEIDTNPIIAQMKRPADHILIPHWYYRSDDYIYQPEDIKLTAGITKFVGSPEDAPEEMYGEGTFRVCEELTEKANELELSLPTLDDEIFELCSGVKFDYSDNI